MKNKNIELYKSLFQKDQDYHLRVCEELFELGQAHCHFKKGEKKDVNSVLGEVADVLIQLEKIVAYVSKFDSQQMSSNISKIDSYKTMKLLELGKKASEL